MPRRTRFSELSYRDRAFWVAADPNSELMHLSWGLRDYGRNPTAPAGQYPDTSFQRPHWAYNLILRGSPAFHEPGGVHPLSADDLVLVNARGNDSYGFTDAPGKRTEGLNWIWRTPPVIPELAPAPGGVRLFHLDATARERLVTLHQWCRKEALQGDDHTRTVLQALRAQVDTELSRSQRAPQSRTDAQFLTQTAIRWMQKNLHHPNAIFLLCDYLQIARSTLDKLFQAAFRESPSSYHLRLRMDAARQWLENDRLAVKAVAVRLGYKHPNDFSRAYKAFHDSAPSSRGSRRKRAGS